MTNADKEKLASLRQEKEELNKSISEKQERIHEILEEIRAINLKDYRQKAQKAWHKARHYYDRIRSTPGVSLRYD